ncbi:spindle and centriole-associated protein 1-like [Pelodytes ibericus]
MSYLRTSRAPSNFFMKKPTKVKKMKVKQEWDNSVNDLTVHRATSEDLVHRHEIHKSKNQCLAHWELQNKSMKKKKKPKQNRESADPLAERRYDIMRKILFDQYNIKDVLEESDRALAVVKDLFGDAPRRRAGNPDVTLAPSFNLETSHGHIVPKKDPPTRLSILSQSTMDIQALNEVEPWFHSEQIEDEQEISMNDHHKQLTNRANQISHGTAMGTEFVTLAKTEVPLPHGHTALNATEAVKRVKTRLQEEEEPQEQDETGSVIGQVLKPQQKSFKKCQLKGMKSCYPEVHSSDRTSHFSGTSSVGHPSLGTSSLDILNQMTQDVERELAEYEKQTGREVTPVPQSQGLTGFTLSLVTSLRRLVSYLRESDLQIQQEILERQNLQAQVNEQRTLIDALTADILSVKRAITPDHFGLEGEEEGNVLTEVIKNLHVKVSGPSQPLTNAQASQVNNLQTASVEERIKAQVSPKNAHTLVCQAATSLEQPRESLCLPSHVFLPAVMLSPPRQQSLEGYRKQSPRLKRTVKIVPVSPPNLLTSGFDGEDAPEIKHLPLSVNQPSQTQRLRASQEHVRLSQDAGSASLPHPHHSSQVQMDKYKNHVEQENLTSNFTTEEETDLVSRMSELTQENSALKTFLKERNCSTKITAQERYPDSPGAYHRAKNNTDVPSTLEMRILELNRQSTEAREKLLTLIELQKQSSVYSPAVSPITPLSNEGKKLEVSIPMPRLNDSSLEETPSPASRSSGRSILNQTGSSGKTSGGGRPQKFGSLTKVGREKGEGWFALSAHVC